MWSAAPLAALLGWASAAHALGQASCVAFAPSSAASFAVAAHGKAAPVIVAADEHPGVYRAAVDFVSDIHKVTGTKPALSNVSAATAAGYKSAQTPIIVGSLDSSALVKAVVQHSNIDVSAVQGNWESFWSGLVKNPLPGVAEAYVIIGADKRGTIYALYDHSEQFGVSPWYWWADVPVTKHSALYVGSGCSSGSPTVQYRGIFLNDEQPALQNWAAEKFTNGTGAALTGSPFNAQFYSALFELLLRLKANYLWPAMWGSAFYIDDAANAPTADLYGIVMGTSHEEPMARSIPIEWNLFGNGTWDFHSNAAYIYDFWVNSTKRASPYETLYTVGMRGNGDTALSGGQNVDLLEEVIGNQTQILKSVYNTSDVTGIPKMWCLYKEVLGYYESGMRVPDDVALMWTDDNWGNMERLPTAGEMARSGGAGVYYHFDYVGNPRDYKWIQSTQLSKTYEQLSLAVDRNATRVWIVNVGDLKPYEMAIEFFITLGWDATKWNPWNIDSFVTAWAQREFDVDAADAQAIAGLIGNVTKFNARRKPELLNGTTYSLASYREAEGVLATWDAMSALASSLYHKLPTAAQAAFFQLVYHPVLASATVNKMWIAQGMNNLRASGARVSANAYAQQVQDLFDMDYELETQYHGLLNGKWDHMMDQTHVMYYYWQQPMQNTMPPITMVQAKKQALPGPLRITPEDSMGTWPGDNPNQCAQGYSCPPPTILLDAYLPYGSKFLDIGAGGPAAFSWTAGANESWVKLSHASGHVTPGGNETRLLISVDWPALNGTTGYALLTLNASAKGQPMQSTTAYIRAAHTAAPANFSGFVEGDGGIAIEAEHAARNSSVGEVAWVAIPGLGRTLSAVTPWPRMGNNGTNYTAGTGPHLEYDFYNFNTLDSSHNVTLTAYMSPSWNANGADRPLALAFQLDGGAPQTVRYSTPPTTPGATPPGWDGNDGWVANSYIPAVVNLTAPPGAHTLKVWMIEPAVVLQKLVINTGGVRPSYLGPPESVHV